MARMPLRSSPVLPAAHPWRRPSADGDERPDAANLRHVHRGRGQQTIERIKCGGDSSFGGATRPGRSRSVGARVRASIGSSARIILAGREGPISIMDNDSKCAEPTTDGLSRREFFGVIAARRLAATHPQLAGAADATTATSDRSRHAAERWLDDAILSNSGR